MSSIDTMDWGLLMSCLCVWFATYEKASSSAVHASQVPFNVLSAQFSTIHSYLCIGSRYVILFASTEITTNIVLYKRWNDSYFSNETLQNIGLEIQLGHDDGTDCAAPVAKSIDFEVLDISGQHTVTISFCGCPGAPHPRVQLLRAQWFPASMSRPNSAFTFDVLNTFQLLNLQGKISAYDFYQSLMHKTDNLGISRSKGKGTSTTNLRVSIL